MYKIQLYNWTMYERRIPVVNIYGRCYPWHGTLLYLFCVEKCDELGNL
jgi:hypothetical protein